MSFNSEDNFDDEETLSDKVIDICHFAYSHIQDEVTRSDIIRDILLECYDKIMEDRFFVLAEIYYIINYLKKKEQIDPKKVRHLKKDFKNWILTMSNYIEDSDDNTLSILSDLGFTLDDIRIDIYSHKNEKKTLSEIKKIKQRLWECFIDPNSKCLGRKIKKKGHVQSYRVENIDERVQAPSFKDTQRTSKFNPFSAKDAPKELRKISQWIHGASKDQTRLNDMNNFNELFSKLETDNGNNNVIIDDNVKNRIYSLWDEVFLYSKIMKKSIKNRILYQLYTIKLVLPELTYLDLYIALKGVSNDENITPEAIYNPTIKTPNDTIREYFTIFFSKHIPVAHGKTGPTDLSPYIKQHHANIKPKYNIKELFYYLEDESWQDENIRSHPKHIFEAKNEILKLLGLKMSRGELVVDESIPDHMVKDTRSPDVLASSIAKILGHKTFNSIVYFRVNEDEDSEPVFKRAKTDFIQSIISNES